MGLSPQRALTALSQGTQGRGTETHRGTATARALGKKPLQLQFLCECLCHVSVFSVIPPLRGCSRFICVIGRGDDLESRRNARPSAPKKSMSIPGSLVRRVSRGR